MTDAIFITTSSSPTAAPERIGIDEVVFGGITRTLLVDENQCTFWAMLSDDSDDTIRDFFKSLPDRHEVKVVSTDLNASRIEAVQESLPDATVEVAACYVQHQLHRCMARVWREEERKLHTTAISDQASLMLPFDPSIRGELELRARARNDVGVLHHSRRLFERPYDRLNSTDRITVEFWRERLPLLKEVYDFSQRVSQLYRREISSEVAEALLNQWLDNLSPDAMQFVLPFAATLRKYMANVCAYWATRYNNLT
jgi:transposase